RAMKNMGLRQLRIVEPPADLDEPEARNLAYGAWDVLDAARPARSLLDAVGDSTFVAGATGRAVPDAWTPRRLAQEAEERAGGGRLSVVFGPESSGLTNQELALCHVRVRIPTSLEHPSLNLAQAVLVLAYELHVARAPAARVEGPPVASAGVLEDAVQELREALLGIGYLNPAQPDEVLSELRGLLRRSRPTPREVTLLRGMARQVAWAGRKARGGPAIG
ncbi:MAG TPA: TrmH family RNA methyltransferase, partial [Vicinamibacteria bacterium]|nr:TrmH family RNA methyltransferase [Vicinamibacteria bacterium]